MTAWTVDSQGRLTPAVADCLSAAAAAPSIHNTQPWRFDVHNEHIDVYADRLRQLDVLDPAGRELFISVGAAVLNLRVALLAHGRQAVFQPFPDPTRPDLAARVTVGRPEAAPYVARQLAWAISQRHTNRHPFTKEAIPDDVQVELEEAADVEGAELYFADRPLSAAILSTVRTAHNRQRADADYVLELAAWTRPGRGRRDGVPASAYAPPDNDERIPLRDFGLAYPAKMTWPAVFEDDPTIAVLYTDTDGPRAWLAAGQALERVLLTATLRRVQSTPMTQPLEIPQLRTLFDDTARGRVAQVVLRLGYAPPATATPRRPLSELLLRSANRLPWRDEPYDERHDEPCGEADPSKEP
jgi:nitroreductase